MPQDDKWKVDMLRKLWGGEETDPEKERQSKSKGLKKSKSSKKDQWPSIDLHRFHELTIQLSKAEKAMDTAIKEGHNGIVIVHGKGEGILRSQLIKELRSHPHVAEFRPVKDPSGESGAIRVRFK